MKTAYVHGKVYTGQEPFQQAYIVENSRFGEVGSKAEILSSLSPQDPVRDLEGRFVCPGFNDSHMHLLSFGSSLYGPRLAQHTGSLRELKQCLSEYLESHPLRPGQWLQGRGWNQDQFTDTDRMPDRSDLDSVSRERPIMIIRACGHCCVVNSAALALAGIGPGTMDPEGGTIGRDLSGCPDGRLYENAIGLLDAVRPCPDRQSIREMLRLGMAEVNRYGITSVQTDDYSTFRDVSWQDINAAYRDLEASGQMTVRVTQQCNFTDPESLRGFVEAGNRTGTGSAFYRIGPLKMVGDGSLGSRTAHLSKPYMGSEGERGFSLLAPETLRKMILYAHTHGMHAAVHAIGDACLDEVLDAYEEAMKAALRQDTRHGIVHCQITRPDQLDRIAWLGLHVYAQSIFLDKDNPVVERLIPQELKEHSYSWKSLLRKGVCVSNGSDCPVELPDVMAGIQCAVTRRSLDGYGPFLPREAFTVREALDSFTSSGARASFEEKLKGVIRRGFLADFTVLDRDPFETDPMALKDIPVRAVFLSGKPVYENGTQIP